MALLGRGRPPHARYAPELRDGLLTPALARALGLGLCGVVLLAAGVLAGRAMTAPPGSPSTAASAPTAVPAGASVGPQRVNNGAGVGFAHGQGGAVAAATSDAQVLGGSLVTDATAYHRAVEAIAAPGSAAALLQQADLTQASLERAYGFADAAKGGVRVVTRSVPLAFHIDQYDQKTARVSVWLETLIAEDNRVAPVAAFASDSYLLQWVGDDWRLTDVISSPGPAPALPQSSSIDSGPPAPLPPQLGDWTAYATSVNRP